MTLRLITGLLLLLGTATLWASELSTRVLLSAGDITVTEQDLQQRLLLLSDEERIRILSSPDTVKDFLQRIFQFKNMVATANRLKLNEEPLTQARLALQQQQILSEALREHTRSKIQLPDFTELAQEHYAARRDQFQLPEQFKAAHILKKVQCECEREQKNHAINKLKARIQSGEDFAALAKTESEDTGSAPQGGDLGRWLKREDMALPFADVLAKLEKGQVSDVVETQFGFHLIKKLDYQSARPQTFEEVRQKLEQKVRDEYINDQLAQKAVIYLPPDDAKFNDSALQSLPKPR